MNSARDGEPGADDDLQLVSAVAAGSAEALARLYDRHAGVVFGMARRIVNRPEDAEEVVQDVFAQVWREASRYERGRASVAGWMVMLARTRAIDRLRARSARPDLVAAGDRVPAMPSSDPGPEQVSISAENARAVRAAVTALPDSQRSLLALAFFEGLTQSEIAGRTGVPLGTVKTRIRTAMAALRAVLHP